MGAKTKEVGGGANTQTAGMWNNFMQQQMGGGGAPQQGGGSGGAVNPAQFAQGPNGFNGAGFQQAQQQQQQGANMAQQQQNGFGNFGNLVNQMSNPDMQQQIQSNPFFQQMMGMQGPQAPQLGQYNTNAPQSNVFGQVFGQGGGPGFLPQSGQQNGIGQIDFSQFGAGGMFGGSGMPSAGPQLGDIFGAQGTGGLLNPDMDSPMMAALRQQGQQDAQLGLANTRARFGAGGGMSLGSGASLAEAQFNRQVLPAQQLALGQLGMQQQEMDMANRGLNANVLLQQRGQNVDQRGQDLQGSIAGANLGMQGQGQLLNAMIGQQSNQLGAFNAANNFNLGMMGNQINAAGMDAGNALTGFQLGNQATSAGNADALNMFGMQSNNFNTQQGMFGNLGMGMQGLNQQGQQNTMNQLFNSFNQSNQIGSPQSQIVQQPSALGQIVNAGATVAGGMLGGPWGAAIANRMGQQPQQGGGQFQPQMMQPNFQSQIPQVNQQLGMPSFNPSQNFMGNPQLGGWRLPSNFGGGMF